MKNLEMQVLRAVKGGDTVKYTVVPVYEGMDRVPIGVTLRAIGSTIDLDEFIPNTP